MTSTLQVPHAPSPPQTWLMRTSMAMVQVSSVDPCGNSAAFPSSTKITRGMARIVKAFHAEARRRGERLFESSVGHVGAADQWRGLDVVETEGWGLVAED